MKNILLALVLLFGVWDAGWWLLGVEPLFPWQLDRQLGREQSELFLLDVRTPLEFAWFHLPGALNLPGALDKEKMAQLPQGRPLVVICLSGHRSPLVAYALKREGFNRVYNLTWGMLGWQIYKFFSPLWSAGDRPERKLAEVLRPASGKPWGRLTGSLANVTLMSCGLWLKADS